MKRNVPTRAWDTTVGVIVLAVIAGPVLLIGTGLFMLFGIRSASELVARRFE
jgi:hypothetical protein